MMAIDQFVRWLQSCLFQIGICLSQIVFSDQQVQNMIDVFEEQIKLANSTDENLRKQTNLFWENTFVRRLLDGKGMATML